MLRAEEGGRPCSLYKLNFSLIFLVFFVFLKSMENFLISHSHQWQYILYIIYICIWWWTKTGYIAFCLLSSFHVVDLLSSTFFFLHNSIQWHLAYTIYSSIYGIIPQCLNIFTVCFIFTYVNILMNYSTNRQDLLKRHIHMGTHNTPKHLWHICGFVHVCMTTQSQIIVFTRHLRCLL